MECLPGSRHHPPSGFSISSHRDLQYDGRTVLSHVPQSVVLSHYSSICPKEPPLCMPGWDGAFIGYVAESAGSRHVFSMGKLKGIRFTSIFRFKVWWTTLWVGIKGSDVETETQIMILDTNQKAASEGVKGYPYIAIIPIYEGGFVASLQAGAEDNIDVCLESGSSHVQGESFTSSVYLHACTDPFLLFKDAARAMEVHLGTFKLLEEKAVPSLINSFGWCTWDAFYLTVNPEGIRDGIKSLADGGIPPKFLIIDDGWQSIVFNHDDPSVDATSQTVAGDQMPCRLSQILENDKFLTYVQGSFSKKKWRERNPSGDSDTEVDASTDYSTVCIGLADCLDNGSVSSNKTMKGPVGTEVRSTGLKSLISDLKEEFSSLENVYMWHALLGYWGGVRPDVKDAFGSQLVQPVRSPGLLSTMKDLAVEMLVNDLIGLVPPENAFEFYDTMHSYLARSGVSGVKLDVIQAVEMLTEKYGGRVELSRKYHQAFAKSLRKNFGGNGAIASMHHCNEFLLLGTEQISVGRVGDDFWPVDKKGNPLLWLQGLHMVHCAYNSLWIGQFMHPDWDMFQTTHPVASFHAASRAISGGAIYVSDTPGKHDFVLLRNLVFPNGTIPRCLGFALPTRDCLFSDPVHDGMTILKMWNVNKCNGVVGAFNCQGGGWCRDKRNMLPSSIHCVPCSTKVSVQDVEWNHGSIVKNNSGCYAMYSRRLDKIIILHELDSINVVLEPLQYDIFTIAPVYVIEDDVHFASIGLLNMINSGGCVESVYLNDCLVKVHVRGVGVFCAYTTTRPRTCKFNGETVHFTHDSIDGRVLVELPWKEESSMLEFFMGK